MSEHLDATPTGPDAPAPEAATRRLGPSPWLWMVLGCALVAASGFVRTNQERLFADAARAAETSPFPMKDLPRELGPEGYPTWQMIGEEMELEPETLQIAGCSDYMYRNYVDRRTGVALRVLVAFGPAIKVYPHSPLVCFPANGFKPRGGPWVRNVTVDDPYELQLMPSADDAANLPTEGERLVIVADVQGVLHLRVFDSDGQIAVDTDETKLADKEAEIQNLEALLGDSWNRATMSLDNKVAVIDAVRSVVDQTDPDWAKAPAKSLVAPFRALAYGKPGGGREELQEVYYSFWHDGQWSPTAEATERLFRHRPAMIKIQVERPIVPGEAGVPDSPIQGFLQELMPEIEHRLARAQSRAEDEA